MIRSARARAERNERGSAKARRARRKWLWDTHSRHGILLCMRPGCELPMLEDEFEVDRIIAGAHGGRYVRGNIRAICRPCNIELGNVVRWGLTRPNRSVMVDA